MGPLASPYSLAQVSTLAWLWLVITSAILSGNTMGTGPVSPHLRSTHIAWSQSRRPFAPHSAGFTPAYLAATPLGHQPGTQLAE